MEVNHPFESIKSGYPTTTFISKWVLRLLMFFFFSGSLLCQDVTALKALIQNNTPDSIKLDTYIKLAKLYRYQNPDSAQYFARTALDLATKAKNDLQQINANLHLGVLAKNKLEYNEAIAFYSQGLVIAKTTSNNKKQASLLNNMGNVYHRVNNLDSALLCYQQSLEIKKYIGDQIGIVKSYNNLGNFFASQTQDSLSKNYYLEGLNLMQALEDVALEAKLKLNLGNAYFQLSSLDSAKLFYQDALTFYKENGPPVYTAFCLHNLGNIYYELDQMDKALGLYQESLALPGVNIDGLQKAKTLNNIGNIHKSNAQFKKAETTYLEALAIADENEFQDLQRLLNYQLSENYEAQNQFSKALFFHKQYKSLHDTIFNAAQEKAVFDIQTKYETAEKEKEIIYQQAENQKKQQQLRAVIGAAIFLVLLLLLAGYAYAQKRRDNIKLADQKAVISKREQEKAMLLRELHHRVKNNLQLVSSLLNIQANKLENRAAAQAVKEDQSRVEAMALIHRDLYLNEHQTTINLKKYLDNVLDNLSRTFKVENLSIQKELQEIELDADVAIPLGLILNELITNSLKHAFSNIDNPTLFVIAEKNAANELYVEIKDNGSPVESAGNKAPSFGLELVKSLARQLKATLTIDHSNGYLHALQIPLKAPK